MKTLRFKILTLVLCLALGTMNAQKQEKKYTERFNVNKDVAIDINTRYTDIEIETWDKNEVVIEAYIELEDGTTQKAIEDYLEKWKFEALGNKSSIRVSSKSTGLIDIHSFDFDSPNYDILHSDKVSDALENIRFIVPDLPELPELPEIAEFPELLIEMPELPEFPDLPELPSQFDFKEYRKDKSYLERWKKKNKDVIGKDAKVKVKKNSLSINSDDYSYRWNITTEGQKRNAEEIKERLAEIKVRREARQKEMKERLKQREAEIKLKREELKKKVKERNDERKIYLIKRQEARDKRSKDLALKRIEVKDILSKREKSKIKRIIKIKAPKGAKFNMNVKFGSMSFPKN